MDKILALQATGSGGLANADGAPDNPFSTLSLTWVCLSSTISVVACVP
jgi:hypothetical protein